ncbi:type II secretion system F family protein [Oceanobacillus chungangensis]|uniref:Pilus assembly protein TadB n=1 Tax=Oceanobacillus chungangensis TaxID=1229152 RepID=A0A3D8Q3E2_9BACI|nr:type II secretion system F family protein [Oceanobacillus chungangensis]RDW21715.1 pilus assembly protein TadB [Oceanobacillus chungangensis]
MTDIVLVIVLVGLVGGYFYSVARRKKREANPEQTPSTKMEKNTELEQLKKKHFMERLQENAKKNIDTHLINYAEYHLSIKEYLLYASLAIVFFGFVGYLFYESYIAAVILGALGLLYPKVQKKALLEKRKEKLKLQFKEAIASLSSSLAAGRSIENSFKEVVVDLYLLYPDPNTFIIQEFEVINRRVENGETIENAILDFSIRSDLEDIQNFANVFITCKRTGGNLVEVIRRTSDIISEKIDIQQEVSVMISSKKFESKLMSIAPLAMILLLKNTAEEYLAPMYSWSTSGPIIMTACLGLLVFAYRLGQRIMDIKV